jgi:Icc-related predicted phosphoesterase
MDEDDRPTSIMSAPPMGRDENGGSRVRIAAVGDVHCSKECAGKLGELFASVHEVADVLLLCGDLTDYGTPEEAHLLVKELASVRVPMVAVLGNHDHETQQPEKVAEILREAGIHVLDGDSCQISGVGFAGVKGFLGGFGRGTLGSWGESSVKRFVQEAIDESLKLESALARLKTEKRIAVLHYSPIAGTVVGEPVEIFPFLGCSRLEEPLVRYPVAAVFHGHAHKGTLEGHTVNGIPVYNVAMPLLLRSFRGAPPFRVIEV